MHEMSLATEALHLIEDAARTQGFQHVRAIWLEIGQLAAVEKEALRFCFDAVTRDSIAEGARIEMIDIPGQGWCAQCADTVPVIALFDLCPRCGGHQIEITGGNEMRVKELEVE